MVLRMARTRDGHGHQQPTYPDDGPVVGGHASPDVPRGQAVDRGQVPGQWIIVLEPGTDVRRGDRLLGSSGRLYTVDSADERPAATPGGATAHVRVVAQRVVDGTATP